jgi:O-antigen/teichoic acid export membrane protein
VQPATPTPSEPRSSRAPLPEGTIPVGIGLLIAGVASFLFLKVCRSALGSDKELAPVTSLWFATFALAPGFFLPVEQELARALSHRRATGTGGWPVIRRVLVLAAGLATLVAIPMIVFGSTISSAFFDDDWVMIAALVLAFCAYAPTHIARGIASGHGRFQAYGIVMGADGAIRIALCAVLAIIGVTTVGPYGLAIAVAPLPGVLWVTMRGELRSDPGPEATWHEVAPNLGWLLLGSVFAAGLVNAGPLAAKFLSESNEKELVTQFSYGVLLARVPLYLFQAVQAALLPRLARLAARNELTEFRSGLVRLMKVVLAVAVFGTAAAFVLGPVVIDKFFGAQLSRNTMAMLALGSALYMIALALAQAVIALEGHAQVAVGWAAGMVTFVISAWLGGEELFRRVEIGLVVAPLAALAVFAFALRSRLARGIVPSAGSIVEAITDMPFET